MWALKRKIKLMLNSKRNLSVEMDSQWSTKGSNFINSKSLMAFADRSFSCTLYTRKNLRLNS